VHQTTGERNYHIFYQLLTAAESDPRLTAELKLQGPELFTYTSQSGGLLFKPTQSYTHTHINPRTHTYSYPLSRRNARGGHQRRQGLRRPQGLADHSGLRRIAARGGDLYSNTYMFSYIRIHSLIYVYIFLYILSTVHPYIRPNTYIYTYVYIHTHTYTYIGVPSSGRSTALRQR
jgi:hypothetical protein